MANPEGFVLETDSEHGGSTWGAFGRSPARPALSQHAAEEWQRRLAKEGHTNWKVRSIGDRDFVTDEVPGS